MESPAVCSAAIDMLDWETGVVIGVACAAATWAAVTWLLVTCVGGDVTCCIAACTCCKDAAWGWNTVCAFVCSWGWTEFRTVAAKRKCKSMQTVITLWSYSLLANILKKEESHKQLCKLYLDTACYCLHVLNDSVGTLMFIRYNAFCMQHLSLACQHCNVWSLVWTQRLSWTRVWQ